MEHTPTPHKAHGAWLFYIVAVVATLVSIDTSWRFFGERLNITSPWERPAMFAVIELTFVACALSMRGGVRRGDGPGPARLLVWAMAGAAAYMALTLAGPTAGIARTLLGPVLAVVCLHLALGIEIKVTRGQRTGTWARIGREMRERALSRLGLADDARDALARTQDRAADRAARLAAASGWAPLRDWRLGRAVRASGATLDPTQRDRVVAGVAALKTLTDLREATYPSPWVQVPTVLEVLPVPFVPGPVEVPSVPVPVSPAPVPRPVVVRTARLGSWDQEKAVRLVLDGVLSDQDIADLVGIGSKTIQRVRRAAVLLRGDRDAEVPTAWKVPGPLVDLIRTEVSR